MSSQFFYIIECRNPNCLFRFPSRATYIIEPVCPKCGSSADIVNIYSETSSPVISKSLNNYKNFSVLLDNIRSAYNVGSILRTSDGFGLDHIYCCGISATPENPRIAKTSLGAEFSIQWSYHNNSLTVIDTLKKKETSILGLEVGENSIPITQLNPSKFKKSILLILGNELAGIDPDIRGRCDQLFFIPMVGYKESYNVTIAFGIAIFYLKLMMQTV